MAQMSKGSRLEDIDPNQVTSLKQRLNKHSLYNNTWCLIWQGSTDKDGYGRISLQHIGKPSPTSERVHRAAFLVFKGQNIPPGDFEISHLCHNKLCISADHLTLESGSVNRERSQHCVQKGKCEHHQNAPDCIFF
jgi:hypothetical protein